MQPLDRTQGRITDVLVIGAGPTGLTMASELLRRGVQCRLLDKALAPGLTSRAMGVQARTLELFDTLGIIEPVLAQGIKGFGSNLYIGEQRLLHVDFRLAATDAVPYPYAVLLPQNITEQILSELLSTLGGVVERARALQDLRQDSQGVLATVTDLRTGASEQIEARFLIGCD